VKAEREGGHVHRIISACISTGQSPESWDLGQLNRTEDHEVLTTGCGALPQTRSSLDPTALKQWDAPPTRASNRRGRGLTIRPQRGDATRVPCVPRPRRGRRTASLSSRPSSAGSGAELGHGSKPTTFW